MMSKVTVKVVTKLNHEFGLPQYATKGSAGFDLRANEEIVVWSGETKLVKTGLFIQLPEGYELQVRPRSGLALKQGITVLNSPGTIDEDYTGEIGVILHNTSDTPFYVKLGDRIAQGVINKIERFDFEEVTELTKTERGDSGFGSTKLQ